ncbi:MAG: transcriptional regulator [Leptospiraceae bacterium]|nr:transcriptional regulator [Leptospiraceae bacterium]
MKIEMLYKHFMITPVSHFPVVDEKSRLKGLFSKEKVLMEMADLASSGMEYEMVPEHFLDFQINENIFLYFQNHSKIPVLDLYGHIVEHWEKPRFLAEISSLKKEEISQKTEINTKSLNPESESKKNIFKYMELILENFPDSLFTTDVEGETTFYNEKFEDFVLHNTIFKNSFVYAEKYFKELNRNLFSIYLKTNELDENSTENIQIPILQSYIKELDFIVRIVTLKSKEKIVGFLYHLVEPKNRLSRMGEEGLSFPSIEEAFVMKLPLDIVMKEVETHFIYYSLKNNQENISQAASQLGVPRSTLQNRIKQLNINELFQKNLEDTEAPPKNTKRSKKPASTEAEKISQEIKNSKKIAKKKTLKKIVPKDNEKTKKPIAVENPELSKKKIRKRKLK